MAGSSLALSVRPSGLPVMVVAVLEVARHNDLEFSWPPFDSIELSRPALELAGPDRHAAAEMIVDYAAAYGQVIEVS